MKTSKRLLSFILAAVMVITSCSVGLTAFAAEPAQDEVFTYITDEGDAVDITYDSLNALVNTYAPELIKALGPTLSGIGVNVDAVLQADEPIYELVAQLSPVLMGLLGGSADAKKVLGSSYTPIDELKYSYLEDDDAAMNFWSLYQFCDKNQTAANGTIQSFCKSVLPQLKELLDQYSNAEAAYDASINSVISKIETLLGSAYSVDDPLFAYTIADNSGEPSIQEALDSLSDAGFATIPAAKDNIGNVICSNGKTLAENITVSDETGAYLIDGTDVTLFVNMVETYAKTHHAIADSASLSPLDAIYYYYNADIAGSNALSVPLATSQGNSVSMTDILGQSFEVNPGEFYYDSYKNGIFSFDSFCALMESFGAEATHNYAWDSLYEAMPKLLIEVYGSLPQTKDSAVNEQWYADAVTTVLVESKLYDSAAAIEKEKAELSVSDDDFAALKERILKIGKTIDANDPAGGAAAITVEQFKSGVANPTNGAAAVPTVLDDASINDMISFAIYYSYSSNSSNAIFIQNLARDLVNWNEGDEWTANMTSFAQTTDSNYYAYLGSSVLNGDPNGSYRFVEAYADILKIKAIQPSLTGYEWDNYKPSNEVAIYIVNTTINGYISDFLNPESEIGSSTANVVNGLLDTEVNLYVALYDVYLRLAEKPVQTIFELLPILVVALDELLVPIVLNGNANGVADAYYSDMGGLIFELLFRGTNGLASSMNQETGSTVGIGQLRWDLNEVLPAVLHWVLGDNSYTYTYYQAAETWGDKLDENGNPVYEIAKDENGNDKLDENGDPIYVIVQEMKSVAYGEPVTGVYGTKYDNDGNKTDNVPVLFNIYVLDKKIAGASVKDMRDKTADGSDPGATGTGELVTSLLTTLLDVVEAYVAEHGNDAKSYNEEGTPVNRGLNNIFVALPAIINDLGQTLITNNNIASDWTFGEFAEDENGCTYNATLKKFKDLAANGDTAETIMGTFVDIFINSWFNAITDLLNDVVSDTENDITSNIPIVTAVLNSLDAFGETSILTDVLNGFFGMTRTDLCSFTFEQQDNGYVGLDSINAYFLLSNIEPLVKLIISIRDANKSDDSEDDANNDTDIDEEPGDEEPGGEENSGLPIDIDKIISDYEKIANAKNVQAAQKLLDTVDSLLSTLLANTYMNGYRMDQLDSVLSAAITFLHNHLGEEITEDLLLLVTDYLVAINAASTKNDNSWNVNSGKDGCAVDVKKVYSKENLSNLVTRTYALVEKILNQFIVIKGDYANAVLGAVEGILSPSAVAVRSEVIDPDIMECYNWTELSTSKYAKALGYDNLKAGDKETFYEDLIDSLGAITAIAGALLCTIGYYGNVLEPIIASDCEIMGVDYLTGVTADTTGEEVVYGILETFSNIVAKFVEEPVSTLFNIVKGDLSVFDDDTLKGIIDGAINPIINEINGLGIIVGKLSPTLQGMIAEIANGILEKVDENIPESDIAMTVLGNLLNIKDLPSIDFATIKDISNGEILLMIYTAAIDVILSSDILKIIMGDSYNQFYNLASMLQKLDACKVLDMLTQLITATQNPTEIYWTFADYAAKETNSFSFPKGITQADADDAVDSLDALIKNVFPLLQSFGVVAQDNLPDLVSNLLFTNEMVTKIAKGVYGAIEDKADGKFSFTPSQLADYLLDSSYGATYSSAAAALKKCSSWSQVSTVNWGFTDGSAKAEQGFINALAALCRPVNDVLAVFLAEGDADLVGIIKGILKDLDLSITASSEEDAVDIKITIKDNVLRIFTYNKDAEGAVQNHIKVELVPLLNELSGLKIAGGNGYQSAIIPLLEALMCDGIKSYDEYVKDYGKAKDNLLINILNPIFGFVDDVLEAPIDTLTEVLPNVAYFIDNNGAGQLVNNLLSPITELLAIVDKYVDVTTLIDVIATVATTEKDEKGKVTKAGRSLTQMIADAGMSNLKLDFADLNSCNIQDVLVPLINSLLKKNNINITIPDIDWGKLASLGTQTTISSAAGGSAIQIKANQGQVLITVLRYIEDVLVNNAAEINKLLCSIDAIKNNKTILAIIDSVFAQIGTAKRDQIVLGVFYLLCGDPVNRFFDYRGFKYKDYEFSYPSTVDVDFLTVIGPMLDGLIGSLVEGGLSSLVTSNVYKDSIISSLAVGLYGAIEGVKINDSMNLAQLLAKTDIDFTTGNVAKLLTDKAYGQQYASAAKVIEKAGSWSKVNKDKLSWGVTDRDSFVHALCAVLRPIYGVLDVLLNDGSLGLFNLIYLPGSDGYTSAIVPLMEAFGLYNIKTQYQYREDMSKEYDAILLDILNPLLDKVEDLLNAPIEILADMLPNLALFFANDGLLQLIENLLTPINALLDAIEPVADVNSILKAAGLDIDKELSKLGLVGKSYHFDIYDLTGSLKPLIGADNIVGLLNKVLGLIKIGGQPLGIELMPIDWYQLASHGEVITTEASQAATFGGRIYVKADQAEVLIAVLRYLINTINYKDNYNVISNLIGGLIGGASDSVSDVIDQVLTMLANDTDQVISDLCGLLQTLA